MREASELMNMQLTTEADLNKKYDAKVQHLELEKELKDRKDRSEANVTVLPQGSGLNFKPHFVECASGAFVMHTQTPPKRIRAANAAKAQEFIALMELVANGKNDSAWKFFLEHQYWGATQGVARPTFLIVCWSSCRLQELQSFMGRLAQGSPKEP